MEQDNPMAAIAVDERIMEQTARLASFPKSGRSGRVEGTRKLVVGHTPFIVV
ncbi:MAG: type II toxin-antitoxin system RelE/ParE family toxin [Desulfonatronovibrio sp.]